MIYSFIRRHPQILLLLVRLVVLVELIHPVAFLAHVMRYVLLGLHIESLGRVLLHVILTPALLIVNRSIHIVKLTIDVQEVCSYLLSLLIIIHI